MSPAHFPHALVAATNLVDHSPVSSLRPGFQLRRIFLPTQVSDNLSYDQNVEEEEKDVEDTFSASVNSLGTTLFCQ